jgi:hypothetical protein
MEQLIFVVQIHDIFSGFFKVYSSQKRINQKKGGKVKIGNMCIVRSCSGKIK